MARLDLSLQTGTLFASGETSTFTGTGGPWGFSPFTSQFGGVVSSAGLRGEPFDDVVYNVSPGDEVIFVVALQNLTRGRGAYDVTLRAALPAGFSVPADGTNLSVTDGAGNDLAFAGDLFGTGLRLASPVAGYDEDSGANVVLATYSLVAGATLPGPNASISSVATVARAAATGGGADEAAGLSAGTTLVSAAPTPVVQAETSAMAVAKGQAIAFDVSVAIPAGTMRDVRLETLLPQGTSQLRLRSAAITEIGSAVTVGGRTVAADGSIAFGTVTSTGDPLHNAIKVRVVVEADGTGSGTALLQTVLSSAASDGSRWSATVGSSVGVVVPPVAPGIAGVWPAQGTSAAGALHPLGGIVLSGNAPGVATLAVTLRDPSLGRLSGAGTGAYSANGATFVAFGTIPSLQDAARRLVFTPSGTAGTEGFTVSLLDANGGLAQDGDTTVSVAGSGADPVYVASGSSLWLAAMPSALTLRGQNATVRSDLIAGRPVLSGFGVGDTLTLPSTGTTLSYVSSGTTGTLTVGSAVLTMQGFYDPSWFTATTVGVGQVTIGFRADPLFDGDAYLAGYRDVAASGIDPFQHFLVYGWREGRVPNALFSPAYYLLHNRDVAAAGMNPLLHYENYGWREGREPSDAFSGRDYLAANPDVAALGLNPLLHYVVTGHAEGRSAYPVASAPLNPLIDLRTYYADNPDVRRAGVNGTDHYLSTGWQEGRNPDRWFDSRYYLTRNADVRAAGLNPLLHYQAYGWAEGRSISLVFDGGKYLTANPDVRAAGLDPLLHYVQYGQHEGRKAELSGGAAAADPLVDTGMLDRALGATVIPSGIAADQQAAWLYDAFGWQQGLSPSRWFDAAFYLSHNQDVAAAHINPLLHYENYGWREGRDPSSTFHVAAYRAANQDVSAAGIEPLRHYVLYGLSEGRPLGF